MNAAAIIKMATTDGVNLTVSPAGTIKATGKPEAVNHWLPHVRENKTGIIFVLREAANRSTTLTTPASRWWLIHYPERDPVEVACCPEANHAEVLERHPDAIAAEPFTPTLRRPSAPMTNEEETAIRAWLAYIEETDPVTIAEVLEQCRTDHDALECYLKHFRVVPKIADDRITCTLCSNLRGGRCHVIRLSPEKDKPRRCKDYMPKT